MVQKVEAYLTRNGEIFLDEAKAVAHDNQARIYEQILTLLENGSEREKFYIHHNETEVLVDMAKYLTANADTLRNLLK